MQEQPVLSKNSHTVESLLNFPPTPIILYCRLHKISPWYDIFEGENRKAKRKEAARYICQNAFHWTGIDSKHKYIIYGDREKGGWYPKQFGKWIQQMSISEQTLVEEIKKFLDDRPSISDTHWEPYIASDNDSKSPPPIRIHDYGISLNEYIPSSIKPIEGNIEPFLVHVNYLCDGNQEYAKYLLSWMAWKVQHPNQKLRNALILGSLFEGTGKSMLISWFEEVIGKHNCSTGDLPKIMGGKTNFLYRKQLVTIEEVKSMTPTEGNKMKALITNDNTSHDLKYGAIITNEDNYTDFILTTNHEDAIYANEGGRRFFHLFSKAKPRCREYYEELDYWKQSGGIEALRYFLQNYSLEDFSPSAPPPITESLLSTIESSRSDIETALLEHLPEDTLAITITEIRSIFRMKSIKLHTNDRAIARALVRLGFSKGGRKHLKDGTRPTIYYRANEISEDEAKPIVDKLDDGFGGYLAA
jgi:Family of unknown function (DUF5906)